MSYHELENELNMKNRIFAVRRINSDDASKCEGHCFMPMINRLFNGEELIFHIDTSGCRGYKSNSGFTGQKPDIPGGAEYFLSYGRGEGFPEGERLKKTPEIAKAFFDQYPRDILHPYNAFHVSPYTEGCDAEIVWLFATPDQLSALIMLYTYRCSDSSDEFFVTFSAGCGSLFAQPFAQLNSDHPKAVIGCTDLASRPYIDPSLLSMSVTHTRFKEMIEDTPECFFKGKFWKKIRERIV